MKISTYRIHVALAVACAALSSSLLHAQTVSIYTGLGSNDNWSSTANWDTAFFPDAPDELAQFSQPVDTDRINMLMTSSLPQTPMVFQTAGILVLDGFVANPVADGNFLFRNSSTGTTGMLRLHGFDTTINGNPATGLVSNYSDQDISFSTVNASFQIELAGSGHFHVEKPGVQTRVIVGITETEGSHGIVKTGAGILHFGTESQNGNYSGGFTLEEGIVQWTNSGDSSANPFGIGTLTLRGGTLRSSTNGSRTMSNSVILDGDVTIGSPEDGNTGNITFNSVSGTRTTTLVSDSTLTLHNQNTWHQGTLGNFGLTKAGGGTLIFTGTGGDVGHFGPTTVAEGTLRLNTTVTSSQVTVEAGATFAFGTAGTPGQGTLWNPLTMDADSTMSFRIHETDIENPENHDSLLTFGTIDLGGGNGDVVLDIDLDYLPQLNDTFLLIDNQSFATPAGFFSFGGTTLIEGSQFTVSSGGLSQVFEISYQGGFGFSVVLTALEGSVSPYSAWATGHGLTGADAEPGANPAGDGHTNLAKFAFGADPTVPTPALAEVSRDGSNLVLRWNERTDGSATYTVENAADLGAWLEYTATTPVVIADPSTPAGYERVELIVPATAGRDFFRVQGDVDSVTLP